MHVELLTVGTRLLLVTWNTSGRRPVTNHRHQRVSIHCSQRGGQITQAEQVLACQMISFFIFSNYVCMARHTRSQSFAPMRRKCQQGFALYSREIKNRLLGMFEAKQRSNRMWCLYFSAHNSKKLKVC